MALSEFLGQLPKFPTELKSIYLTGTLLLRNIACLTLDTGLKDTKETVRYPYIESLTTAIRLGFEQWSTNKPQLQEVGKFKPTSTEQGHWLLNLNYSGRHGSPMPYCDV
jgi:hypothetical protein